MSTQQPSVTDTRSLARTALNLYLQGNTEAASILFEKLLAAVAAINPSLEAILCRGVSRLLEKKYDIKMDDCSLFRLREKLREIIEARVTESEATRDYTPAEVEHMVSRRVSEILCDIGFLAARMLGLV